jgi:ABC-type sugar transport system permease subunit
MEFIGFKNYTQLFGDKLFWSSLRNTLMILVIGGAIIFPLGFFLTVVINSGVRFKKLFRALVFIPNVIATIALTTLWAFIYNPRFGLWNGFFNLIGMDEIAKVQWLAPDKIFYAMMIALIWIAVGFYLVLLMAGVDKIPFEFYEAAKIEGASQFQMFKNITLPLLMDVISVAVVLWSIFALKLFEFPYAFSGIQTPSQLYTVGIYLYIMGFGKRVPIYRLGYATAIGVMLLLSVIVIVLVIRRLLRREVIQY